MRIATALFQGRLRALFRAVKRVGFRPQCARHGSAAPIGTKQRRIIVIEDQEDLRGGPTQVRLVGPFSSRHVDEINFGSGSGLAHRSKQTGRQPSGLMCICQALRAASRRRRGPPGFAGQQSVSSSEESAFDLMGPPAVCAIKS
jgi:hypothetical protein